MKNQKNLDSIGYIDPELIIEAGDYTVAKKKRTALRLIAAAACVCLAIGAIFVGGALIKNQKKPDDPVLPNGDGYDPNKGADNEILEQITEKTWSQTANAGRYTTLSFGGSEYITAACVIKDADKGALIGRGKAEGQDFFSLEMHETGVDVYAIKGVDTKCAVAVHFDESDCSVNGDKHVYCYFNASYAPETLGELLNDVSLIEKAAFGSAYKSSSDGMTEYKDYDRALIKDLLLSAADAENERGKGGKKLMSISVSLIGMNSKSISLTDGGYITTNLFETEKCFFVGKDKIDAIIKAIELTQGEKYIPDIPDGEIEE